jgi:hypothetical protein
LYFAAVFPTCQVAQPRTAFLLLMIPIGRDYRP